MPVQLKTAYAGTHPARTRLGTAAAYEAAGQSYLAYADGDAAQPFAFTGPFSYADREIWRRIDAALVLLAAAGADSVRLLDAGCGPGTWLRRASLRAAELGFSTIRAIGIDSAPAMIGLARASASAIADPAIDIELSLADLAEPLPYRDDTFDISLCLYGALNHLPVSTLPTVAAELARVTNRTLFVAARSVGSLPTIYVDALDQARSFRQDHGRNWMDVELKNGAQLGFPSHLFTAHELQTLFQPSFVLTSLHGLDVFHSRFAVDPNWNPQPLADQHAFEADLDRLERRYADDARFIDRAAHILLIAQR